MEHNENLRVNTKSTIFFIVALIVILAGVLATYYRYVMKQNFDVIYSEGETSEVNP